MVVIRLFVVLFVMLFLCSVFFYIAERSSDLCVGRPLLYREWDLNPHSHFWPKDFKSFVSTDSTIAASLRMHACMLHAKSAAKIQNSSHICK